MISTENIGVNTNFYEMNEIKIQQNNCNCSSMDTNKLLSLNQKVIALEEKLTEANNQIWRLTLQLNEEKAKNWRISNSTTSDESKNKFWMLDKFLVKSTKPVHKEKSPLKRNRSSNVHLRGRFNKIQDEEVEDEEFK